MELEYFQNSTFIPTELLDFYCCTIESICTNDISVWYGNCSASDCKTIQWVVENAQRITSTQLHTIKSIYHKHCLGRTRIINSSS